MTGIDSDASSRIALQSVVDAKTVLYEKPSSGGLGYSNDAFPPVIPYYYSVQYYDDYSFPGASSYTFAGSLNARFFTRIKVFL